MTNSGDQVLGDEERVRAAIPALRSMSGALTDFPHPRYSTTATTENYRDIRTKAGYSSSEAWSEAANDAEVVAFEARSKREPQRVQSALAQANIATRPLRQQESGLYACVDCNRPMEFCICPKPGRTIHSPASSSAVRGEPPNKFAHLVADKRCCTVCDAKKFCHVCEQQTLYACSDCRIDFGVSIYVCGKASCRAKHESMCSSVLRSSLPPEAPEGAKECPACDGLIPSVEQIPVLGIVSGYPELFHNMKCDGLAAHVCRRYEVISVREAGK